MSAYRCCTFVHGVFAMGSRRGFGSIRRLPSNRFQASYGGPDLQRHAAPTTFKTKSDAKGWLTSRRAEVSGDEWRPPIKVAPLLFCRLRRDWLERRDLKPKTRQSRT